MGVVSVGTSVFERPVASATRLEPRREQQPAEPDMLVLRVSGGKRLHIHARLLVQGSSWGPQSVAWHEVALYRENENRYAVAVTTYKKAAGESDCHRAESFDNLDEAIQFLEEFDPSGDLTTDIDASDPNVSGAVIALQAAALRQRIDTVTRQYRSLLGEMLYALDTAR